jgi:exonuclease SbcD
MFLIPGYPQPKVRNCITIFCKHIVITGGNHDAPGTINAPKELLSAMSIHVVGKATENIEDEVFELAVYDDKIIIAAVPYLRDQDIRRAVASESFEQIGDRYKTALVNHYNEAAEYCSALKTADTPVIGMGHLFAIGGSTSDSEQSIYVGNLGDIGAQDFPEIFDYIALGHLHRPQKAGKLNHIRYSGSPCILSFSEIEYAKNVVLVDTIKDEISSITEVEIPKFREFVRIKGSAEECISQLEEMNSHSFKLTPWVEVVLDNKQNASVGFHEINKAAENLNLEVLKVTLKNERRITGLEQLIDNSKHIKDLKPMEVFKMKCREQNFDLDTYPEVLDAFNEVVQIVREKE